MGQLFCYLVHCTHDPKKIIQNENRRKWRLETRGKSGVASVYQIAPGIAQHEMLCSHPMPKYWQDHQNFDRTTTNRDQAKPTTLIPSCPIKIQLKNYPQGNISSLESSLKTNLWRKFPIQICKGQGATKKLLKPRCGSIELNIRAGF